jgi:hypothetical protein
MWCNHTRWLCIYQPLAATLHGESSAFTIPLLPYCSHYCSFSWLVGIFHRMGMGFMAL